MQLTPRSRQLPPEPQAPPVTKIAGRLNELATGEYFCGISNEELMQLFF